MYVQFVMSDQYIDLSQGEADVALRTVAPDATLAARSSSVLGLIYSVKAGIGIGPLPRPLGDAEPDLVRVLGPVTELSRIWRLLTTRELRRTPRVSAFFDFIVEEIETLRPILKGWVGCSRPQNPAEVGAMGARADTH